jgi:hypothetical protein
VLQPQVAAHVLLVASCGPPSQSWLKSKARSSRPSLLHSSVLRPQQARRPGLTCLDCISNEGQDVPSLQCAYAIGVATRPRAVRWLSNAVGLRLLARCNVYGKRLIHTHKPIL